MLKRVSLSILIALVSFSAWSFASEKPMVASTLQYPPYEYLENGKAKGIAVDVIREALRRVGKPDVRFDFYPWKRAVMQTRSGKSDILFNAGKNKARQEWGYYVDSVLIQQSFVLFKRKGEVIDVAPDFTNVSDKTIAVRHGYLYGSGAFRQALDSEKFKAVSLSDSSKQSIDLLLNGRVDLFVGDSLPVLYYINQQGLNNKIDMVMSEGVPMEVLSWPTHILFSKERVTEAFVEQVNQAMEAMKADGTFAEIQQRYSQ